MGEEGEGHGSCSQAQSCHDALKWPGGPISKSLVEVRAAVMAHAGLLSHHVQPTSQRGADFLHVSRACGMHGCTCPNMRLSGSPTHAQAKASPLAMPAPPRPHTCQVRAARGDSAANCQQPTANSQQPGAPPALPTWPLLMAVRVVAATMPLSADRCSLARRAFIWPWTSNTIEPWL